MSGRRLHGWARIGIVLSMVWAIMGSIWALNLLFETVYQNYATCQTLISASPSDCQQLFQTQLADARGRRLTAVGHCGPRTCPRGVDACLRPGRPSPLDQTRLPTLNLALSHRRFSPTGEQFRLISSEPSITKRRGFFATHSEALSHRAAKFVLRSVIASSPWTTARMDASENKTASTWISLGRSARGLFFH